MATSTKMDGIELLIADHRKVDNLFLQCQKATTNAEKKTLSVTIIEELAKHSAVEKQVLYPVLRRIANKEQSGKGDQMAEHALQEHYEVELIMEKLEKMDPADPQFMDLMKSLQTNVQHHVGEEEKELFPVIRKHLKQDDLMTMGTVEEMLKKTAPNRPHPEAPSTQPAISMVAPLAAFLDRVSKMLGIAPSGTTTA